MSSQGLEHSGMAEPTETIGPYKGDVAGISSYDSLDECLTNDEVSAMIASGFPFSNIFDIFLNLPPEVP